VSSTDGGVASCAWRRGGASRHAKRRPIGIAFMGSAIIRRGIPAFK
jgi:hypothetical protein